jgi:integrase
MPLTVSAIHAARPRQKPYKLYDRRGLYLLIAPSGARAWRFKYHVAGREKLLALGLFPDVTLALARDRRDAARRLVANGGDPSAERQAAKLAGADTFRAIANEWLAQQADCVEVATLKRSRDRLAVVARSLGQRPIGELLAKDFLPSLRSVEGRGRVDTAHRTRAECSRVMCYAVATGRAVRDPLPDLREALKPLRVRHFAAITEPARVAELLRAIHGYQGQPSTEYALKLSPYVFVRPTELRSAAWAEFDLESAVWRIPAARMKAREAHIVPLAHQVVTLLRALAAHTGDGVLLFPSLRTPERPMSDNTVNAALRRLGFSKDVMTGHGFRSMASTLLNEQGFAPDVIELQLAHIERNKTRAAYNRASRLAERAKMMQAWADYLDGLKGSGSVVMLRRAAA